MIAWAIAVALLIDVNLLCFEQGSKYLFPDEQMVVNRLLFCPLIQSMETKAPGKYQLSLQQRRIEDLSVCVIICAGLDGTTIIAQLNPFIKSLKPLVDESETSHHIVLSVVRESETCHKKSQPGQKKSETCVNCVILSTSWFGCDGCDA